MRMWNKSLVLFSLNSTNRLCELFAGDKKKEVLVLVEWVKGRISTKRILRLVIEVVIIAIMDITINDSRDFRTEIIIALAVVFCMEEIFAKIERKKHRKEK